MKRSLLLLFCSIPVIGNAASPLVFPDANNEPESCLAILQQYNPLTGDPRPSTDIYTIWPAGRPIQILCDMDTNGGGWSVIHVSPTTYSVVGSGGVGQCPTGPLPMDRAVPLIPTALFISDPIEYRTDSGTLLNRADLDALSSVSTEFHSATPLVVTECGSGCNDPGWEVLAIEGDPMGDLDTWRRTALSSGWSSNDQQWATAARTTPVLFPDRFEFRNARSALLYSTGGAAAGWASGTIKVR